MDRVKLQHELSDGAPAVGCLRASIPLASSTQIEVQQIELAVDLPRVISGDGRTLVARIKLVSAIASNPDRLSARLHAKSMDHWEFASGVSVFLEPGTWTDLEFPFNEPEWTEPAFDEGRVVIWGVSLRATDWTYDKPIEVLIDSVQFK
jgi:hypothetical protein